MSNKIKHRHLGRTSSHRKALLINLARALIEHGEIKTTLAKAKELKPYVEKLVTKAKKGNEFNTVRYLKSKLNCKETIKRILVIAEKQKERPGGYTRVLKAGFRAGDSAPMAVIQFVE